MGRVFYQRGFPVFIIPYFPPTCSGPSGPGTLRVRCSVSSSPSSLQSGSAILSYLKVFVNGKKIEMSKWNKYRGQQFLQSGLKGVNIFSYNAQKFVFLFFPNILTLNLLLIRTNENSFKKFFDFFYFPLFLLDRDLKFLKGKYPPQKHPAPYLSK